MPSKSLIREKSATGQKPARAVSRNGLVNKTPLPLDVDHAGFREDVDFALSRAGNVLPVAADHIRAEFALRYRFPGEFVAFIDEFNTEHRAQRLQRSIVAHGLSFDEVTRAIDKLDPDARQRVALCFVEPADVDRTNFPTVLPERS